MRWMAPVSNDGESYCGLLSKQPEQRTIHQIGEMRLSLGFECFCVIPQERDTDHEALEQGREVFVGHRPEARAIVMDRSPNELRSNLVMTQI